MSKMKEYIDAVNEKDEVIEKVAKSEIYSRHLNHRIVHIMIFNGKGELALQLRSAKVDFCPGHWSTPVGGRVQSGESYLQAALRECKEELGVEIPIELDFKAVYHDPRCMVMFQSVFKAVYNGPFKVDKNVVQRVEFFTFGKIEEMIAAGEKFHPELLVLLKHYLK
ncbi:MAG: NUDIX domain-containing protein [Candidatus Woesearchaeota archaeon]